MQVGVVGLGEVGLKFAALAADAGMQVIGTDTAASRRAVAVGELREVGYEFEIPRLEVSAKPRACDVQVICVDSPVDAAIKTTNLDNLLAASGAVGEVLRRGDLVVVRSTVPVGATRTRVIPVIEACSGLSADEFLVVFAPERTSTGGTLDESRRIRHLVGGRDLRSAHRAIEVMTQAGMRCLLMESLEAAELGKLATNVVRDVNQAIANQICRIAESHGVDIRRLVDDVNLDYPRDRLKHASPGVGGSCLTKDPYILAESLRPTPPEDTLFGRARLVNDQSQDATLASLLSHFDRRKPGNLRVLVCGAAFKGSPPTTDMRHSVGLHVADRLLALGYDVNVFDPVVAPEQIAHAGHMPVLLPTSGRWDAVLVYSNNSYFSSETVCRQILSNLVPGGYLYDPHQWFGDIYGYGHLGGTCYRTLSTERVLV